MKRIRCFSIFAFSFFLTLESMVFAYPNVDFVKQPVDHFNILDFRTWQQKYYYSPEHYKTGGIVILGIHGLQAAGGAMNCEGVWYEHAMKYYGYIFSLEHRYFGDSRPVEELTEKNMKFLTLRQAVGDTINFISHIKREYKLPHNKDTKWIVYGCGPGGTIATLLRIQRPDLVDGVVAFGSPLNFTVDFPDFFNIGKLTYDRYSPPCVDAITEGFRQLDKTVEDSDGLQVLREKLNLCDSEKTVLSKKDVDFLYWMITYEMSQRAINENIYNTDVNLNRLISYASFCQTMTNNTRPILDVFLEGIKKMLEEDGIDCLYLYDDYVKNARNTSYSKHASRQSRYSNCYVGFNPTSDLVKDITGDHFNLDFHLGLCKDIFPSWKRAELEKYVKDENRYFNSVLPKLTNAIFTVGTNDLWISTTYNTTNPKSKSITIEGASHCADWYKAHPEDTPQLTDARNEIMEIVGKWIAE